MNTLYEFQHRLLPGWTYNSIQFFNDLINNGEKQTLYRAIKDVYDKRGKELPFCEDDFGGYHARLDVDTVVVVLRFPEPQEVPMCYCSFIYLDTKSNRIAYYTMEKGKDPIDEREIQFLCGWNNEGKHSQYGSFYRKGGGLGDVFLIRFFYMIFRNLKGILIPEQLKEESEITTVLKCPACQKQIIFDASNLKEGNSLLILCDNCLRIFELKYENSEFLIQNKIKE